MRLVIFPRFPVADPRRAIRQQQNAEQSQLFDEFRGVAVGLFGPDREFLANVKLDNFGERCLAINGVPNNAGGLVEAEQCRVNGGHDPLAAEIAGGDASRNVFVDHPYRFPPDPLRAMSSQVRWSDVNTS
jgi:hypothetical protein